MLSVPKKLGHSFKKNKVKRMLMEKYKFFHNIIRGDIFDDYLSTKKNDRFGDNVKGYYIFHQLRICLNCVLDANAIFPEIKEKYLKINGVKD